MKKLQGLVYDMSSEDYHNYPGVYSSSQLKKMLEDEELFYKYYIEKSLEKEHSNAFDVGTYFHTAMLEPDKIDKECAVFKGIRRGKVWDEFQVKNKGKAIITENEMETVEGLIKATKNSPCAMELLSVGHPEVSAFVDLIVTENHIFSLDKKLMLSVHKGWVKADHEPKDYIVLSFKVRADKLADPHILDLKSTTGNAKNEHQMKGNISRYVYDLSAAFYVDLFYLADGIYRKFAWIFSSKDKFNSKSQWASLRNIQVGRAKWKKAVLGIAKYTKNNWQFEDTMGVLEPEYFQLEWIKEEERLELL